MGLLDFINTPQGIGLLSAVAGGMAGARRGTPWNNVGRGLVTGVAGYQTAQDQIRQDQENALTKQYRQMQMAEMERKISEANAQKAWKAGLPGVMAPKLTGSTDQGRQLAEQNAAFGQEGLPDLVESAQYAQPNAPLNMNYGVDKQAMQDYLMQPDSPFADDLIKQQIMPSTEKPQLVTVYGEDGRPMQKWVKPGESTGVDVGMGKSDTASMSSVGQMIAEMNKLPPNDPARAVYRQAISKATTHAPAAQMNNYGSPVAGIGPDGKPVFFQTSKTGGAPSIVPGVAPAPKPATPPTEAEAKAAFYAGNMKAASQVLDSLESNGFDPTSPTSQVGTLMAGGATNLLANKQAQQARQAQNQWAEQMLRMQTGAAATQDEINRTVRTYFPSVGDTPEVVEQKRLQRQQAEQGVLAASGRAYNRVPKNAAAKAQPMPAKPSPLTLKKGVVYKTPKGELRWNGKAFEDVR